MIGTGAMGNVYLAEDTRSGDRVALKVLRAELTEDERFRQRFERESAIATGLTIPSDRLMRRSLGPVASACQRTVGAARRRPPG